MVTIEHSNFFCVQGKRTLCLQNARPTATYGCYQSSLVPVSSWCLPESSGLPSGAVTPNLPRKRSKATPMGGVVDIVEPENSDQVDLTHVEQRDPDDPLAIGGVDAPVTLVVFSDYQCPYCASWSEDTLPAMMDYVDVGDLRIEWRDLNVYGALSEQASKASFAAGLQDKFWQFHDELFLDGEIRSEGQLTQDAMLEIADNLGIDTEQFIEDMRSDVVNEQIQANEALGTDLGAYSTPAFVLGGQPMLGAQPTNVFVDAMEDALATARD